MAGYYRVYKSRNITSEELIGVVSSLKEAKRLVAPLKEWAISHFPADGMKPHALLESTDFKWEGLMFNPSEIDQVKYPEWHKAYLLMKRFKKQGTK